MILGRNCRFLQGEATAPSSVKSVKEAIAAGQEVTQLLLNYKLDGTPFVRHALRDRVDLLTWFTRTVEPSLLHSSSRLEGRAHLLHRELDPGVS